MTWRALASHGLALGVLAACLQVAGCRDDPPSRETPEAPAGPLVLDLAAALPASELAAETDRLAMGQPETRRHLLEGWAEDEADGAGPFVWSVGQRSSLELFVAEARAFELGLRCQPFTYPGAPEQRITVALGRQPVGEIALHRGPRTYRLPVPAELVADGRNLLSFEYSTSARPADVVPGSPDPRRLAVQWREITFDGLSAGTLPRVAAERPDRLEIPLGAEARIYFPLDAPGELTLDSLTPWGPRGRGLELVATYATARGHTASRRFDPWNTGGARSWPLDAGEGTIARLSLRAVRARGSGLSGWVRGLLARRSASGLALGGPRVLSGAPPPTIASPEPTRHPNVIVYLVDTLRADHLGTYGYPRPTSPHIDRFAEDATVFLDARAPSSWTRPSVASLFTGLGPRRHGVHGRQDPLSRDVDTLAELLAEAGYATAAFVTNGNVAPTFAFEQGFGVYRYLRESGDTDERHQLSDVLNGWAFHWLEQRGDDDRPFFLYLHATDPHAPYVPREPFRSRFAASVDPRLGRLAEVREIFRGARPADNALRRALIDLYDAEIAFNDHHFGELMAHLRQLGLYDDALILLISDHGEEFLDHAGWEHGKTLYAEQLNVPLILKLPGSLGAGRRVPGAAGHADLLPTLLEALGLPPPDGLDGESLLPAAHPPRRPTFAHLALASHQLESVTASGHTLILDRSPTPRGDPVQLYRLADDPRETRNLAASTPFEKAYLRQLLARRQLELQRAAGDAPENVEIPTELREQLEALGYL